MKSRKDYIEDVMCKLEEISPFNEPDAFIEGDSDSSYNYVQPVREYIQRTLDEAARNCLRDLPLSLLHADALRETPELTIADDGVATFPLQTQRRYYRIRHEDLERDITTFITSEDPMYLIMQNKHTRPKQCKTMAVESSDMGQMEIYTLTPDSSTNAIVLSIDLTKKPGAPTDYTPALTPAQSQAQLIQSPIEELIVLECAAMVFDILGKTDNATICRNEKQSKIDAVLQ